MSAAQVPANEPLITYTLFPDVTPHDKTERADVPWHELVGRIERAPTYLRKGDCPLISIAEYGDLRSDKDCLRHAANVKRIFGVEIDYDGEAMPIEEAANILHSAGILSCLYTSPSHRREKPRWRVLLPLSEPAVPQQRASFVGRVNRLLGGVATRESFTLSQSFYLGRVKDAEYIVLGTEGVCIDLAGDLEPLYYASQGSGSASPRDPTTDAQLRARFVDGTGRYEAMLSLSARWAARGMSAEDIETSLAALLDLGNTSQNADGIDLHTRCRPMALSAVRKFGETRGHRQEPPPQQEPPPKATVDTPPPDAFEFHTPSDATFVNIPPRPFIYRRHYMRGMVSVTAAAGGSGKSSIVLVEMISIAMGVDLLADRAELATGPQNVWYHNGEDPEDEIRRRIAAICKHYSIEPAELANRLYWTVGRDCPLIVARELPAGVIAEPKTVVEVIACMKAKTIAVLAVDPFISTHRVSENSNDSMEVVMSQYREISEKAQAAIEAVHHFRKSNGTEASVDDIRGASAMIGAARSARILCAMSKEEAQKAGVDQAERRRYIWEGQAKANMYVASDRRTWREMVSIDLENAADPYESDKVGVATHWEFPNSIGTLTDELFATAIGSIRACKDPLRRRVSMLSNGWVGKLICEALDVDAASPTVRAQVGGQIKSWIDRGLLIVDRMHSPRQGREVDFVSVVDRD